MNELLKKILKKRIIEKLNSWSFSFIKKKDGSTRIYIIDYRRVQKLLKKISIHYQRLKKFLIFYLILFGFIDFQSGY